MIDPFLCHTETDIENQFVAYNVLCMGLQKWAAEAAAEAPILHQVAHSCIHISQWISCQLLRYFGIYRALLNQSSSNSISRDWKQWLNIMVENHG